MPISLMSYGYRAILNSWISCSSYIFMVIIIQLSQYTKFDLRLHARGISPVHPKLTAAGLMSIELVDRPLPICSLLEHHNAEPQWFFSPKGKTTPGLGRFS
jgi:hypothetical protein